jgi:hypothetical protein
VIANDVMNFAYPMTLFTTAEPATPAGAAKPAGAVCESEYATEPPEVTAGSVRVAVAPNGVAVNVEAAAGLVGTANVPDVAPVSSVEGIEYNAIAYVVPALKTTLAGGTVVIVIERNVIV